MVGDILKNRYHVQEKIAEGNLFTVYKCEDKINNKVVAVKVLLPQYSANRMFAERMLVEAQAMIGVKHPGMVEVFDCGDENGEYFVVVEYIRGLDLKERIRRGAPFTLSTAVDVCIAVCDVLDYAHKRGFIHGDLRPGNILVTTEGQIKVADFWVNGAVASQQAVRSNTLMSSIHYMAPEVAEGKPATPASDVYSMGILLFELLTAVLPFDAETPVAIAMKHAREPIPSMRHYNPAVPKAFEALVARALQKEPEDRFRSAKSMLNELKSAREALHLSKPLVWSETTDGKPVEPVLERSERRETVDQSYPPWMLAMRKALIIFILIAFVAMTYFVTKLLKVPQDVKLPDMIGKSYDSAQAMVAHDNISLVRRSEEFNETYPEGQIFHMSPGPGRSIKSGKSVDVWVSKGSKFAMTPNLMKLPTDAANQRLRDAGLNVGEVGQDYDASLPEGTVMRQTPSPGTKLERGQTVAMVYSLGPKPSETPATTPDSVVNPPDEQSTDSTNTSDGEKPAGKTRSFDIKLTVPQGAQDQVIEIGVEDDNGPRTAYSEVKHPGDKIKESIQVVGSSVTVRIFIDGKLVKEERK